MKVMKLRVAYKFFWPGFEAHRSLFTFVLRDRIGYDVEIVAAEAPRVDLEIRSVFPFPSGAAKRLAYAKRLVRLADRWDYVDRVDYGYSRRDPSQAVRTLWFTGENRRPPLGTADAFLTFDVTDTELPSMYFPFWMYRVDWGYNSDEVIAGMTPEALSEERTEIERPMNCCAFSTSREPGRLRIFDIVESEMPLDRYGSGIGKPIADKLSTARGYGFQACPENDLYPGYVTEKAPESWFSGNIPIWQGIDREGWLNREAMVDTTNLTTQQIRSRLSSITVDHARWMRSQAILTRRPSLEPVTAFLKDLLT